MDAEGINWLSLLADALRRPIVDDHQGPSGRFTIRLVCLLQTAMRRRDWRLTAIAVPRGTTVRIHDYASASEEDSEHPVIGGEILGVAGLELPEWAQAALHDSLPSHPAGKGTFVLALGEGGPVLGVF